jgi:hypothetical protein
MFLRHHIKGLSQVMACAIILSIAAAAMADDAIYVGGSPIERSTAFELQRLWHSSTGVKLAIRDASALPADASGWLLGTPENLPDLGQSWPFDQPVPLYDGYIVSRSARNPDLWIVAATKPEGISNGVFGALEAIGFRFGFDLEIVPENATMSGLARFVGSHSPAFAVRGLIPRYGNVVGASAWEWPDYRAYIDDMRRMGLNAVAFYCTDFDPFTAYEFEGEMVGGERSWNTAQTIIGDAPVPTSAYVSDTGSLFPREHFGVDASFIENRSVSIRASQDVLARAIRYAKSRGLFVGIGFEVFGDPTLAETLDHLAARVQSVLQRYPEADSFWIWEPNSEGARPTLSPRQRSVWDSFAFRWSDSFSNVSLIERRAEAVRMGLFAQYTRQLVYTTRPDITIIAGGRRGPMAAGFEDFYPGLDRILPADMVIAGMDSGNFDAGIASEVGSLRDTRMRIPVLTLEKEDGLLGPQPILHRLAGTLDDAKPQGMMAVYGAHWRTATANESVMYFARNAWRESYDVEAFLDDRARTEYGGAPTNQVVSILNELQNLGFGWTGAALIPGQMRPGWQVGLEAKRTELLRIGYDVRGLLENSEDGSDQSALRALAHAIDATLKFDATVQELAALDAGRDDAPRMRAWLDEASVVDTATSFAHDVSQKDDLGALALLNLSAWASIHRAWPDTTIDTADAAPRRQAPGVIHVLPGRVIVVDRDAARMEVRVVARAIGDEAFHEHALRLVGGQTFALTFPPELEEVANIEFGVVARLGARKRIAWPADFPDRLHSVTRHSISVSPGPVSTMPSVRAPFQVDARIRPNRYSVELTWQTRQGELYTILRDGEILGTVPGGWFEDTHPTSNRTVTYAIEARRGVTGPRDRREIRVNIPDLPLPKPPKTVRATARANRIVLGWQSDAPQASSYYVLKYNDAGEVIEETYIEADLGQYLQMSDHVESGRAYRYTVSGVAPDGRVGEPSTAIDVMSSREPLRPILQLSFNDDRYLEGLAELAENALALGGAGWAELPPQPNWNPSHALTLSTWVRIDDLKGMPVLITKGTWLQSGYFLQINQGRIRFTMAGIDTLDAGNVESGRWHLITATYGFGQMRIYLDGEQVGRKNVSGRPRDGGDSLLVGRYIADEDVYFLRGSMDDIRIYDVPLTSDEVRTLHEESFRE